MTNQTCLTDKLMYHTVEPGYILQRIISSVTSSDVEYYRDLEMWVRGHSSSLKVVPFESLGIRYPIRLP